MPTAIYVLCGSLQLQWTYGGLCAKARRTRRAAECQDHTILVLARRGGRLALSLGLGGGEIAIEPLQQTEPSNI